MIVTDSILRSAVRQTIMNEITIKEMRALEREVMPYFKEAILEERQKLRTYMLVEGYIDVYEHMLIEDKQIQKRLDEGFLSTVADIGITAGQMVGGGVGQLAGIAGVAKYTPEFLKTKDGEFLNWFGPLISLFFSLQALLFPAPAIGSLKMILQGFTKGVVAILKGSGGLLAKGVTTILSKGSGFIAKAIELLGKGVAGIGKAIASGGDVVVKLGQKLGGGKMLSTMFTSLKGAMSEVMKRMKVLQLGLKEISKKTPGVTVKGVLEAAFKGSKGATDDAAALVANIGKVGGTGSKVAAGGVSVAAKQALKGWAGSVKNLPGTISAGAKAKLDKIVGGNMSGANKFMRQWFKGNPQLLQKFVGREFALGKGGKFIVNGVDDAGNVMIQKFVSKGGKLVDQGVSKMTGAQFVSSHSKAVFGILPAKGTAGTAARELKVFTQYLQSFYPAKRAALDVARIMAAGSGGVKKGEDPLADLDLGAEAGATGDIAAAGIGAAGAADSTASAAKPVDPYAADRSDLLRLAEGIRDLQRLYSVN